MNAIILDNLSKIYTKGKKAVNNISFTIKQGEVFGFLGPNGSGKTTAVKLLNGILTPTSGTCRVFDIDPFIHPEQVHKFSGIVTEHAQMYDNLTGIQNLIFYGSLFGIDEMESKKTSYLLLDQLGLSDATNQKLGTYSTGMRQRLSLARAMIHHPKVLFLDEPTSGLDPESVLTVNNMIKNLAKNEGTTIFLCTHQLRYAQEICNSYGLIDKGELLAVGNINELFSMASLNMTVSIKTDCFPKNIPSVRIEENHYEVNIGSEKEIPSIIKHIINAGGNIYSVLPHKISLEEIYLSLLEKHRNERRVNYD